MIFIIILLSIVGWLLVGAVIGEKTWTMTQLSLWALFPLFYWGIAWTSGLI